MIGVGGIGSGVFFALDGNHTLGREESRGGRFLDRRDYCKLHIVSHTSARCWVPASRAPDGQSRRGRRGRPAAGEMWKPGWTCATWAGPKADARLLLPGLPRRQRRQRDRDDSACAAWMPPGAEPNRNSPASPAGASPWRCRKCRWRPGGSCWSWERPTAFCGWPPSFLPRS